MFVFRISKSIYAETLMASGRPNRWNSEGKYVLYCASSLSLACLETIVHSSGELLYKQDYKSIKIQIPDDVTASIININSLPENWKDREQKSYTQGLGDRWYTKQEELLLQVPSAIISTEVNF